MNIEPSLPNAFNPQTMHTSKRSGVSVCQGYIRGGSDLAQKPEHKPIIDYQVRQLVGRAFQAGTNLARSAAGFAFSQVMNSPYVGAVAPELKQSLLFLAILYNQQQAAQAACRSGQYSCDDQTITPLHNTTPEAMTASAHSPTSSQPPPPAQTATSEAMSASVQARTFSQTPTPAQTATSEAMSASVQARTFSRTPTPAQTATSEAMSASVQARTFSQTPTPAQTATSEAMSASVQARTFSQTPTLAQTATSEAMSASVQARTFSQTPTPQGGCTADQFRCDSGQCISNVYRCDGSSSSNMEWECVDGSDEKNCTQEECSKLERFICDNGKCLSSYFNCDQDDDCGDLLEERATLCNTTTTPQEVCTADQFRCDSGQCISNVYRCDGSSDYKWRQAECLDGSDEKNCTLDECHKLGRFICDNGECISLGYRCDGSSLPYLECDDGSDEKNCTQDECNNLGRLICDNGKCLPSYYIWDDCDVLEEERTEVSINNLTTPTQTILKTNYIATEFDHPADSSNEFSAYAWYAAIPTVLTLGAVSYVLCAYASYNAIKQANPTLPTGQALSRSLWHPLSFRQSQQQLAAITDPLIGSDKTPEVLEMQLLKSV